MKTFFLTFFILIFSFMADSIIFDFNKKSNISQWKVVDDVVMGGRSDGSFTLNEAGNGVFSGDVSLENNGGFSSVRYNFSKSNLNKYTKFIIKLKGDKKSYQFRVKSKVYDYFSYTYTFDTNGTWQTIEIPFNEMNPVFRGRKLQMKAYPAEVMEEIAFLIGNKKNESFLLEIDSIGLGQ